MKSAILYLILLPLRLIDYVTTVPHHIFTDKVSGATVGEKLKAWICAFPNIFRTETSRARHLERLEKSLASRGLRVTKSGHLHDEKQNVVISRDGEAYKIEKDEKSRP